MNKRITAKPVATRQRRPAWLFGAALAAVALAFLLGPAVFAQFVEWMARRNLSRGKVNVALTWLERCGGESSQRPATLFLLGRVWRRLEDFDRARMLLARAEQQGYSAEFIQREHWLVQAQSGQIREVERHLGELLRTPLGDESEICEAFVRGYRRVKRFSRSKEIIDAWQADFPSAAQPRYWRGRLWQDTNFVDLAESEYRRAVELQPDHVDALLALAQTLQQRQALSEALQTYERLLALNAQDTSGLLGAASCLRQLGRAEEARHLVHRLHHAESSPDALLELGTLDFALGDYVEAVNKLTIAHRNAPQHGGIRHQLALALAAAGRIDESKPHFAFLDDVHRYQSQAQELSARVFADSRDAKSRVSLAQLFFKLGSDEEALRWLYGALEIEPRLAGAHQALIDYYERNEGIELGYRELARRHRSILEATPRP